MGSKGDQQILDGLASALDCLADNPDILRLEPEFCPGLYFYRFKKHVLVCDYRNEAIIVLTIIHTSMDLPNRLLELEPRLLAESEILQAKLNPKLDPDQ